MVKQAATLKSKIMRRINSGGVGSVWTPIDFLDLGTRDVVDKTLQRLIINKKLRRITRGLYDRPQINALTNQATVPDYRKIIDAIGRRDQIRILIDGLTCANELGLTNAVPGKVIIATDGRLKPIKVGKLTISFKLTAPSKLYWSDHPGMRIVQSLYWLRDTLKDNPLMDRKLILKKICRYLQNSPQRQKIRDDLQQGLYTLPAWMQELIQELLIDSK